MLVCCRNCTLHTPHFTSWDLATISWFKLRRCGVIDSAFFVAWHCVCNNWVVRRLIGMTSSEAVSGAYHGRIQKTHRLQALPNMPRSRDHESGYARQFFRHACYSDAERSWVDLRQVPRFWTKGPGRGGLVLNAVLVEKPGRTLPSVWCFGQFDLGFLANFSIFSQQVYKYLFL